MKGLLPCSLWKVTTAEGVSGISSSVKARVDDGELESKMFSISISRNSEFMVSGIFPMTAEAEWSTLSAVSPAVALSTSRTLSPAPGCWLLPTSTVNVKKVLLIEEKLKISDWMSLKHQVFK